MIGTRVRRIADLRPGEERAALLAATYFFCLLAGYYIIRPLRDEMGIAAGVRNLPYLYLVTLAAMLLVAPAFGILVRRFRREVFIPLAHRFFIANLLLFFVLFELLPATTEINLGRAFYVWTSVFNLFTLSLFWAYMADVFGYARSKRLFALIAVGGTAGALLGSSLTALLVEPLGRVPLLLIAAAVLELAVRCMQRLGRPGVVPPLTDEPASAGPDTAHRIASAPSAPPPAGPPTSTRPASAQPPGAEDGGVFAGIRLAATDPYLLAVTAYLFLYSLSSTFIYFEQANIVDAAYSDRIARTALFASIDTWVNGLTLVTQLLWSGRIIKRLGVALTLALLPMLTATGLVSLGLAPILPVLVVFQVIRRATNYALVKPARETLFTIVSRDARYKAKNFIDTFVYRGGDALGAWTFSLLQRVGLSLSGIAFTAVPIAVIWAAVGLYLGRRQSRLAANGETRRIASPDPSVTAT